MNSTTRNNSQNWLAPLSLIHWKAGNFEGHVKALSEEALKLEGLTTYKLSFEKDIQLQWEQSFFSLRGYFAECGQTETVFLIDSSETSKVQDLLNSLRKSQHLSICRDQDVESSDRFTGFSDFTFIPEALPDWNKEDLNLKTHFLGREFQLPFLITGMTGGIERGQELNRRLARAAQRWGIPMGIGSQRMALENPEYRKIFTVKDEAPNIFLIGNLGGSQLCGSNAVDLCKDAVEMIGADALAIHLNVIQECVQSEGSPQFRGLFKNLERICSQLKVPVIIKEVGSGISAHTAKRLLAQGVSAIDCGGRGGTSWAHIEGLRSLNKQTQMLGQSFRDWGIPTAYALQDIRRELKDCELIATGGIRDGLTVAKALALGANMVGIGLPFMRAASESEDSLHACIEGFVKGLQTTMLAINAQNVGEIRCHNLTEPKLCKVVAPNFRVPGKLMLSGEYAVLFGEKALAYSVDSFLRIEASPSDDGCFHISSNLWKEERVYKELDFQSSEPLIQALIHSQNLFANPPLRIKISSQLDMSAGMGSSSAVILACCKVSALFAKNKYAASNIPKLAYKIQKTIQGQASGYDVLTQWKGGLVSMQYTHDWPGTVETISVNKDLFAKFIHPFAGGKGSATSSLLKDTLLYLEDYEIRKSFLKASSELTESLLHFIKKGEGFENLLQSNAKHRVLISQFPHFPKEITSELLKIPNCDKTWSFKTTGAGGEDSILLLGEEKDLNEAKSFLLTRNWYPLSAKFSTEGLSDDL